MCLKYCTLKEDGISTRHPNQKRAQKRTNFEQHEKDRQFEIHISVSAWYMSMYSTYSLVVIYK